MPTASPTLAEREDERAWYAEATHISIEYQAGESLRPLSDSWAGQAFCSPILHNLQV